jgi:hypothetical protein
MALGAVIRNLLGARLARHAGRWYRSIFVDLAKEAEAIDAAIPRNARLLDIGGGDGEPLNHLLSRRPDIYVTTIDPAPVVGQWIEARFEKRVTRMPRTSLTEYLGRGWADPDAVLIADVLHHIPGAARPDFMNSIGLLLQRVPHLTVVVKDVEPGHWRARLGFWSDRYVTGDLGVNPISRHNLSLLFQEALGPLHREDTNLFESDAPNYAVTFFR